MDMAPNGNPDPFEPAPGSLWQHQVLFSRALARLLNWAIQHGEAFVVAEVQRSPTRAIQYAKEKLGIAASLHVDKLAVDLDLFRLVPGEPIPMKGVVLTDSARYADLGAYWKSLHPLCRWGGDFKDEQGKPKPDGRHFSVTFRGRQ